MSKKTKIRPACENCKWWRRGDLSAENIGNKGACVWMLKRTPLGKDSHQPVPFWAGEILRQTISWEGESCGVWQRASRQQIETNCKP